MGKAPIAFQHLSYYSLIIFYLLCTVCLNRLGWIKRGKKGGGGNASFKVLFLLLRGTEWTGKETGVGDACGLAADLPSFVLEKEEEKKEKSLRFASPGMPEHSAASSFPSSERAKKKGGGGKKKRSFLFFVPLTPSFSECYRHRVDDA